MNKNNQCQLVKKPVLFFLVWLLWISPEAFCVAQDSGGIAKKQEPIIKEKEDDADDAFKIVDYPIAIVPFKSRGREVDGMGEKVTDLIFANLVVDPGLLLVDREDLDTILAEAELSLSGLVNPQEAVQVGQLTGARLIVTGSVFKVDESIYVVAKIIGTETTRVVGASAKGRPNDPIDKVVESVAEKILKSIQDHSDSLVAKKNDRESQIAEIKKKLEGVKLPVVFVTIEEQHVGQNSIDPAAEIEIIKFLRECGFEVIDPNEGQENQADFLVKGEGISEFATRTGKLVSAKARLEVKITDRATGKVVAVDRQTRLVVGLSEQIAGKQALQDAADEIAERIVERIVTDNK